MVQTPAGAPVIPSTGPNRVPVPLTAEEADAADLLMAQTLNRLQAFNQKLASARAQIDEAINSELDGKELSFAIDVKKKHGVARALKKLYGEKKETITYAMYKEMLAAKVELEKKEVADYAAGKTSSDEDEESEE